MNNKAQFNLMALAVISVIVLISVLAFVFSSTFRFIILGIGLFVLSIFVLAGRMIKNNKIRVWIFAILLGAGLVLILGAGTFLQSITGERYVEVPFFATISCERGISSDFQATIPSDGDWFYKGRGLPENADAWNIKVKTPEEGSFSAGKRVEYYICNSRDFCSNKVSKLLSVSEIRYGTTINIGNVDADKFVWVQYQTKGLFGWKDSDGASLDVTYKPFSLIRNDPLRGGRQEISSVGCQVPTSDVSWLKRVTGFSGSSNIDVWSGGSKLEVGQIINYISGDIVAVNDGNLQSGGWCIFENGVANIYEIEQLTYGAGNEINRVNLDNRIGSNECCDGEVYPNNKICQNGEFISIEEAECSSRRDCGTLEFFPIGSGSIGRLDCVNEKCETVDIRTVECTSDQQCKTNEKCSRNTFICEVVSAQGGTGEETQDTCTTNADCLNGLSCLEGVCDISEKNESKCNIFEKNVIRTEKKCGIGCLATKIGTFGILDLTKEVEVEECVTANWVSIVLIVVLVGGLGALAIVLSFRKGKKGRGRKR